MNGGCAFCGADGALGHHVTGRDVQGRYLDPRLRCPLCHDHHLLLHDDWRVLGIEDPDRPTQGAAPLTVVECVERRLRRLATLVGRVADVLPASGWLAQLARSLKRWADELARHTSTLDARYPEWRADQGHMPDGR